MIRLISIILLAGLFHSAPCSAAPPPVTVTMTQSPAVSVRLDDGAAPAVSLTVLGSDVISIVTAGPQGIPGPKGDKGDPGVAGAPGQPGPSNITAATATDITGYLHGNGAAVAAAGNSGHLAGINQGLATTDTPAFDGLDVGDLHAQSTVGIGTTSPTAKFSVLAPAARPLDWGDTVARGALTFVGPTALVTALTGDLQLSADNGVTTGVVVKGGTGNVGMGTTNPGAKLHIEGVSNADYLRIKNTADSQQDYTVATESTGVNYGLSVKNSFGLPIVNFDAGQKLGIATNDPSVPLDINASGVNALQLKIGGFFGLGFDSSGQQRSIIGSGYGHADSMMSFTLGGFTTASDKLTILGSGNVGIGTATPQSRLHVQGDIQGDIGKFTGVTINGAPLAPVATSNDYNDLINKPIILRGYDGREIELQTSATHIQWRYVADPPGPWNNLVALAALSGTDGTDGQDGRTILSGSGVPADTLGTDGDFYLDTTLVHLYGPKAAGAWPGTYIELVGPQGEPGPPGPAGNVDSASVRGALDDPIDGAVVWVQQGPTEAATEPKIGVKDRNGNSKQWTDGNGTVIRQCITADSAPAFKMIAPGGAVIYALSCDNTMTFTGTVTIK